MLRLNQNNLEEYLKKTEAEQIYMKKINSINMSFTSLLTSIQSVFSTYDYQLSTIANSLNVININTSNININLSTLKSSFNDLYSSYTSYTTNNDNEISNIKINTSNLLTHLNSHDSEISNLWDAISQQTGQIDYNYFKELNKTLQETYMNFDYYSTQLDNEQFIYKSNYSSNILLNIGKKSYAFCNLGTTSDKTFTLPSVDRVGLRLPGNITNVYNSSNITSTHMNIFKGTCKTLDIVQTNGYSDLNTNILATCDVLNLINSTNTNDFNLISDNINCKTINFSNYIINSRTSFYSTLKLNDNVEHLGKFLFTTYNDVHIDLRRNTINNLPELTIDRGTMRQGRYICIEHGKESGYGIGSLSLNTDVQITAYNDLNLNVRGNSALSLIGSCNGVTIPEDLKISDFYITYNSMCLGNVPYKYTGSRIGISNLNPNNTADINLCSVTSYSLTNYKNLSIYNNTFSAFKIGLDLSLSNSTSIENFSMYGNNIRSMTMFNYCPQVMVFNNNTISSLTVHNYGGNGISFGSFFNNNSLVLSSINHSATYYDYNNPDASISAYQGLFKLNSFNVGYMLCSAGGSMENCTFKELNVLPMNGVAPYGPWKYVNVSTFNLVSSSVFYYNKLNYECAFYHCPFIKLNDFGMNEGFNNAGTISNKLMFVGNTPTSSVNFALTGGNTSKSVNAKICEDQASLLSVDIRGWHPTRIVGFDQNYLFNNVASDYSNNNTIKFTMMVDNVTDWEAYKAFINPFNDGDGINRVVLYDN